MDEDIVLDRFSEIMREVTKEYNRDIEKLIIEGKKQDHKYLLVKTDFNRDMFSIIFTYCELPIKIPHATLYDLTKITNEDIEKFKRIK